MQPRVCLRAQLAYHMGAGWLAMPCASTTATSKQCKSGCAAQIRCSINVAVWTPEGRRCLTGTQSGEFTLWNGSQFNFETILQARHRLYQHHADSALSVFTKSYHARTSVLSLPTIVVVQASLHIAKCSSFVQAHTLGPAMHHGVAFGR